ncbi:right-handed parallel beta-helix repeat-containing protein [Amphiplicatus metriothermophilus]|uniref:Right handed beta helix region n=1 Tax=Amphiplicatus metriothermophilus TaxID=1519374 RepID=A0A239PKK6_9PROT|nr:right-handed parallel beta-helix repeat-containing protein [Amphiplicatus metriothermophilus]MBB5517827.1 hypothetical protein [Amphiplicatus metriothermophilus]SNT67839.1 Right handed beta helix region [Amphiplicatus metriothermophilus]
MKGLLSAPILAASAMVIAGALPVSAGVKPGDAASLTRAIADAEDGARLVVPAGEYALTDVKLPRSLTLVGEGAVVFRAAGPVEKGILNPLEGVSLRVENISFRGARSADLNGAGIRHDGADLTVIDCAFYENENGVLATGVETGRIRISGSFFIGNGHGDGYSHGIYVVRAESLTVESSRFEATRVGHHVKSLARRTLILGSHFDDTGGRTSYALDVSAGGDVVFAGNTVVKSADADNAAIVNYDLSRGGAALGLRVESNQIVNRHPAAILLRNRARLAPVVKDNQIVNEGRGGLRLVVN